MVLRAPSRPLAPLCHPNRRCPIQARPYSFLISAGEQTTEITGREAAITQAKTVSENTRRPVGLKRADGKMAMEFHHGALQTFRLETR